MTSTSRPDAGASPSSTEPTLDEILADPLVHLILRRDGLTLGAVRAGLDRARQRLPGRDGPAVLPRAA